MQSVEEVERICYQAELDRAERYINETYEEETEFDYHNCLGWDLGECRLCPQRGVCFPKLTN